MEGGASGEIFDRLLSAEELNKVRDKFMEDCEHSLEEAMRKHVSLTVSKLKPLQEGKGAFRIPIWIWGILLFFAYDDIFRWMTSPLFFYPLLMLGGVYGILSSLGLAGPAIMVVRQSVNLALTRAGINFEI